MKRKTFYQISFCSIASLILLVVILAISFSGCSKKRSFVSVSDTRGLTEGAPVIWYDNNAYAGKVFEVKENNGFYFVYIDFQDDVEKNIHAGVKACPVIEKSISSRPVLMLVGGTDASLPALAPGSQIPEMSLAEFQKTKTVNFWSWFSSAKMGGTLVVAILLLIIFVILMLKIVAKLVKIGLVVAIIVILFVYFGDVSSDWNAYKEQFSSMTSAINVEKLEGWVKSNLDQIIKQIPDAIQYFGDSNAPTIPPADESQNNTQN